METSAVVSRSWVIWVVALSLVAYGGYALLAGQGRRPGYVIVAVVTLAGACGLVLERRWAQFVVYATAVLLVVSWLYFVWREAATGWPYPDALETVLALGPGALVVLFSVVGSLAVFRHFDRL
jgi:hypothetical protein